MTGVPVRPSFPLRRVAQSSMLLGAVNVMATGGALALLPYATAAGQRILVIAGALVSGATFLFGTMLSLRAVAARRVGFAAIAVVTLAAGLFGLLAVVVPEAAPYFISWAAILLAYVGFVTVRLVQWEGHPSELPRITLPVFISYRRDDSLDTVGRIHDRLRERIDDAHVFLDVDDQSAGEDYRQAIERALDRAVVMFVVIGPHWLSMVDGAGRRRLDNPADMVRIEIESALRRGTHIIPLLVEGAVMPAAADLPESLRPMSFFNAVPVRPDPDFSADMQRLIDTLADQRDRAAAATQGSRAV
jgi:hypothetical protein